ncbi:MAG: glycosyltransferase, partial [Candidatus Omnitrophota bacterium]|nr:glycosyltransferase [Candidatus Omnitrophota bacterium]
MVSGVRNDMATKIYFNYHGLESEWFSEEFRNTQYAIRNTVKILAIGRLVEQKGFEDLITACGILRDKGIDFECNIVGEGPLKERLASSVERLALQGKVNLLGMKTQEEIKQLYREADIFAAPSVVAKDGDRDGIPNVVLEAMAMGLPVVSTDVSGLPEVVINEKTGLVVPARSHESLAMAMEIFIKDGSLRNRLGRQGKEHVQTLFDLDKNINGLIDIFKENVLEKKVKILYLIWSLGLGGAERVVINLAKGLDRTKFNPMVCCLNAKGQFACELENAGIAVIALHKRGPFDIGVIGKLVSVIKKHEIDIMNTHLFGANFWGRIAANIAAIPVIATEHNVDVWKTKFHFALDRLLARKTNKIIAVSNTVKEFYADRGIRPDKIRVIYNGIEVSGFSEDRETDEESRKAKCEFGIKDNETVLAV